MKLNKKLLAKLKKRLRPKSVEPFKKLGKVTNTPHGPFIHINNGGSVLGVAHMDYVDHKPPIIKNDKIYCPQLDDRLGIWILLDVLPFLGHKFDVLLTDSEEKGESTAQYFQTDKQYNWIFQFDRNGTDLVMYDYETIEYAKLVKSYGFTLGSGILSDICYLEHLEVAGFNIGTGYYHEHTQQCFADLTQTLKNVVKFAHLFSDNKDRRLNWCPDDSINKYNKYNSYLYNPYLRDSSSYNDDARGFSSYDDEWICSVCGYELIRYRYGILCSYCDSDIIDSFLINQT